MKFEIGYFEETADGSKWRILKQIKRASGAEAETEVDGLFRATPPDFDGYARTGLYIKRGSVKWFRRFSHYLYMSHPKRRVEG